MLAFLLQTNAWIRTGQIYLFAVFMAWVWALWILRTTLSSYYKPYTAPYLTTTSVIIPVVDEPPDLFRDVLRRINSQHPTEIIVVINGARNEILEQICIEEHVRWAWTEIPGKRNALQIGVGLSTGEIAVLVDSDTLWTATTLGELVKPFADPSVGGATTRQRILNPGRGTLTRWADWLENVRNEYSMPAMSVLGRIGCLPGRTIAFRRKILVDCMDRFLTERYLGVLLEVSDDRTLTNYTLMAGYRTVYQAGSLVYTDAPTQLRKLAKQQYRWARGSQYNTLRMLPWMLRRAPMLAVFYLSDIAIPFILVGSFLSWGVSIALGKKSAIYDSLPAPGSHWLGLAALIGLSALLTMVSLSLRFGRHFAYNAGDLARLPAFMVINTFLLLPVRVLGFFRLAHNASWGTRKGGFAGERSRNPYVLVPYLLGALMLAAAVMISV